jgi:hypothetical protein
VAKEKVVPFLLEARVRELGGKYTKVGRGWRGEGEGMRVAEG